MRGLPNAKSLGVGTGTRDDGVPKTTSNGGGNGAKKSKASIFSRGMLGKKKATLDEAKDAPPPQRESSRKISRQEGSINFNIPEEDLPCARGVQFSVSTHTLTDGSGDNDNNRKLMRLSGMTKQRGTLKIEVPRDSSSQRPTDQDDDSDNDSSEDFGTLVIPQKPNQRSGKFKSRGALTKSTIPSSVTDAMMSLDLNTKIKDWIRSFRDLDPRVQILHYFNAVAFEGAENLEAQGHRCKGVLHIPKLLRIFIKSDIFSVWRPTSEDAIAKMMSGEGTGKGLEIKGKSAKCGRWSGFVPYLQIHDNEHKKEVGWMTVDNRVRIFYPDEDLRDMAWDLLADKGMEMNDRASEALQKMEEEDSDDFDSESEESIDDFVRATFGNVRMSTLQTTEDIDALAEVSRCFMEDASVRAIDDYDSKDIFGLEIPEKLFWEAYVFLNDITRPKGSDLETGRPSMPAFQQMNIETLRNWSDGSKSEAGVQDPRPVLWYGGGESVNDMSNPLFPQGLLMAYEENDTVTPVVSDFDCFLLGTRGVKYEKPFRTQELSMLSSCIEEIEGILATPRNGSDWTGRWLDVKKKHAHDENSKKEMPKFGYADPLSYSMMTGAVHHMTVNGAVRHGPECFNYGFPQELDDTFLVISDTFPGVPWRYANGHELIDILNDKISEGFTFPLNPKWVLCDPGWKKLYDNLLASEQLHVQSSLDIWYPDEIRRKINEISKKYPQGFVSSNNDACDSNAASRYDLAQLELNQYTSDLSRPLRRESLGSTMNLLSHAGKRLPRSTVFDSFSDNSRFTMF